MHANDFVTGTHTGDGNAKNVSIGFKPKKVMVYNITDGISWEWTDTMAAAKGVKVTNDGTTTYEASNGISHYAGSTTASEGFTLGTGVNLNAKELHWTAQR